MLWASDTPSPVWRVLSEANRLEEDVWEARERLFEKEKQLSARVDEIKQIRTHVNDIEL